VRPEELPQLDPRIVQQIPRSVARRFRLLAVAAKGDCLVVVCSQPLTDQQEQTVKFLANREHFEFVTDPKQFPEVRAHLDALINLYFPPGKGSILSAANLRLASREEPSK
jgi:hypothetical protein